MIQISSRTCHSIAPHTRRIPPPAYRWSCQHHQANGPWSICDTVGPCFPAYHHSTSSCRISPSYHSSFSACCRSYFHTSWGGGPNRPSFGHWRVQSCISWQEARNLQQQVSDIPLPFQFIVLWFPAPRHQFTSQVLLLHRWRGWIPRLPPWLNTAYFTITVFWLYCCRCVRLIDWLFLSHVPEFLNWIRWSVGTRMK